MVEVRPLEQSDHADWRRLWTAYLEFYNTKLGDEVYANLLDHGYGGFADYVAVQEAAGRLGVTNVYWMTHETNATARKLYDSVARRTGFIEYDMLK